MRRPLLAIAAVVLAMGSAPASADPPSIFGTTCGLLAVTDQTEAVAQDDVYTGVIFAAAVGVDVIHPTGNPTVTGITCTVKVNGVVKDTASKLIDRELGLPVAVVLEDTQFVYIAETPSTDYAEICTTITSTDNLGYTARYERGCQLLEELYVPQDEICDLLPEPFGLELCDLSIEDGDPLLPVELLYAIPGVVTP